LSDFPPDLQQILRDSFALRTTVLRRDGTPRTVETTYWWDGGREVVLSGFPGKRDWVASMRRSPQVQVHTVEFAPGYDVDGVARVLRDREQRLPYLYAFIDRWTLRPGFPRRRFQFALGALKLNRRLRLPWWGPFWVARRILDAMPCVVIQLTGAPRRRSGPPPEPTPPRAPQ
jgi:hypothetical protein